VGVSVKGLFMETFKMVGLSSKAIGKTKNQNSFISLKHL